MNIALLKECSVLFNFSVDVLCYKLTFNHAWHHLEFSPLVHFTM